MFGLPLAGMMLLASTSLVHGQSPESREILSQHRGEWLRSLEDAPITIPEHFRMSARIETEDLEWKIPVSERLPEPAELQATRC